MEEEILIVRENPIALILNLPDGCTAGRFEAAEAFVELVAEVRRRYPNTEFQYLSFSYAGEQPALSTILAIGK